MLTVADALTEAPFETAVLHKSEDMRIGDYYFSDGWFFKKKIFGAYDGFKAADVCWVYPHRLDFQHAEYIWSLKFKLQQNKEKSIETGKSPHVDHNAPVNPPPEHTKALLVLTKILPWAFFGYQDPIFFIGLPKAWGQDRELFINVVQERFDMVRDAVKSGILLILPDGSLKSTAPFELPGLKSEVVKEPQKLKAGPVEVAGSNVGITWTKGSSQTRQFAFVSVPFLIVLAGLVLLGYALFSSNTVAAVIGIGCFVGAYVYSRKRRTEVRFVKS